MEATQWRFDLFTRKRFPPTDITDIWNSQPLYYIHNVKRSLFIPLLLFLFSYSYCDTLLDFRIFPITRTQYIITVYDLFLVGMLVKFKCSLLLDIILKINEYLLDIVRYELCLMLWKRFFLFHYFIFPVSRFLYVENCLNKLVLIFRLFVK